jgi:hypothetical protein
MKQTSANNNLRTHIYKLNGLNRQIFSKYEAESSATVQSLISMGVTGNATGLRKKIKVASFINKYNIKVHVSQLP